ncbi:MAG: ABC transporter substrate-binding protein, partial [Candidatus Dormibacteraceae bacterium]
MAKCFLQPGTYGRDVISSGPYMIKGSQHLNISSCATMTAISGFDPTSNLSLVRNPNYQPYPGSPPDYLNGVDITIDSNVADIFDKVTKGQLDSNIFDTPPSTVIAQYQGSAAKRKHLHSAPEYLSESITMNLAVPPFTNVHVRKAVAWVLDKSEMVTSLGGSEVVKRATHVNPPGFPGSLPASYNPFPSKSETGNLSKAKAEMRLSPYDPKHNGMCNVSACKNLVFINKPAYQAIDPTVQNDLAEIGIDIVPRVLTDTAAYEALFNVKGLVPLSGLGGGGTDYTGANSFAGPNFASSAITGPSSCCNYSLVSLTKAQAAQYGVPYPAGGIPSVDGIVNRCLVESGSAQDNCYEGLDKKITGKIVAWVPYIWG